MFFHFYLLATYYEGIQPTRFMPLFSDPPELPKSASEKINIRRKVNFIEEKSYIKYQFKNYYGTIFNF